MIPSVTALAQAGQAGKIRPVWSSPPYYGTFGAERVIPWSEVDKTTAALMAKLTGGKVIALQPRETWMNGVPNSSPLPNLPTQLFISYAGMPNAPNPGALLVVNGGDMALTADQ